MADFTSDYLYPGTAVLSDSLEILVSVGNFTVGLNNFIIYEHSYIERTLIVECRGRTSADAFVAMTKVGNEITFDGHTYKVKDPISLIENWGEAGGAWSDASWRYNLILVREET